ISPPGSAFGPTWLPVVPAVPVAALLPPVSVASGEPPAVPFGSSTGTPVGPGAGEAAAGTGGAGAGGGGAGGRHRRRWAGGEQVPRVRGELDRGWTAGRGRGPARQQAGNG